MKNGRNTNCQVGDCFVENGKVQIAGRGAVSWKMVKYKLLGGAVASSQTVKYKLLDGGCVRRKCQKTN